MPAAPVALLGWDGGALRTLQDAEWKLEDREDSTNRLSVTTSLAEADGVRSEQELIFKGRRFTIAEVNRDRAADEAVILADEVQAELADLTLVTYEANSWTLEQAMEAALADTRWTLGDVQGIRYGRAHFQDITVLDALKFLARHQDARLTFDSLRRRVNITAQAGTSHEYVFTYGRQLTNIEKDESAPTTTVIYPTGADGMTVVSVNNGVEFVEDYGYYTAQGITLADARARHRKEAYWEDSRYEVPENLLRDAQNRLAEEAYPAITYTLTAAATVAVDGVDDFDLAGLHLGDQVYVWDEEIDAKLRAEVTEVTTSSDASENRLTLAYLPDSLGAGVEGKYFGDSGRPSDGADQDRSVPQPRPSMPILESIDNLGTGTFRWNGQDENGNYATIPARFGTVETVAAALVGGAVPSPASDDAFAGTVIRTRGGGITTVGFGGGGEFAVWLFMVGRDGQTRSEYSEPLVVDVPERVDTEAIQVDLDAAQARLDAAETELAAATTRVEGLETDWLEADLPALRQDVTDAQAAVDAAETRLDAAETEVQSARLGMENLRDVTIPNLDQELRAGIQNVDLSVESLQVGNWDNLFGDPQFALVGEDGSLPGDGSWTASGTGVWYQYVTGSTGPTLFSDTEGFSSAYYHRPGGKGVAVRPGETYDLEVDTRRPSGAVGAAIVVWTFFHRDGTFTNVTAADIAVGIHTYAHQVTVPNDPSIEYMGWGFARGSTATGYVQIREIHARKKVHGRLLVDGTVEARHIVAESIAAAVGEFLELNAGQITAGTIATGRLDVADLAANIATIIQLNADRITTGKLAAARVDILDLFADNAFIQELRAGLIESIQLTAQKINAGDIIASGTVDVDQLNVTEAMTAAFAQFLRIEAGSLASNEIESMSIVGGTVEGTVMRGNLFETNSQSQRGLKIDDTGQRVWDSSGNLRYDLNASTGDLLATGTFRTELSGNRVELYDDAAGGDLRFYSGSKRGSIKASSDAIAMVFGTPGAPEPPYISAREDQVVMGFRSQQIEVGGTGDADQYMRFRTHEARFYGNILSAGGARHQFTYGSNTHLGYVGQRPESGGTPDFELRTDEGGIRLNSAGPITAFEVVGSTIGSSANVHIDMGGRLWRSSSASRYKLDQQPLVLQENLFVPKLMDWVDKSQAELKAQMDSMPRPMTETEMQAYEAINLRRIPGGIAEHLEAAGLQQYVVYGPDGQTEEVMYDRWALSRTEALYRMILDDRQRIDQLEAE